MRRSEKLVCWVEPDVRRAIEAAAQADERSVSDWLRLAAKHVAAKEEYVQVLSDQWAERARHETAQAIERDRRKPNRHVPDKS